MDCFLQNMTIFSEFHFEMSAGTHSYLRGVTLKELASSN